MELWNQEGLFPQILNGIFGANSPTTPDPTARPAQAMADYPSVNLNNPSADMLRQAQILFPGAAPAQLNQWIAANPESFKYGPGLGNPYQPLSATAGAAKPDIAAALGKATGALGGGTGNPLTSPGGGVVSVPPPPALARPGGGGGGGPMVSPVSAASQLTMGQLPGMAGPGYPLGPASTNPFVIALLKQKLGLG